MSKIDKGRILIILYYYHPYVSGLSLLAKMQAEGLAARGYAVTVLTTRYRKGLAEREVLNGVHVVRAKTLAKVGKGVVSWDFLRKIVALSRSNDVINPHLPMAHFGLVLPFLRRSRIVSQYHCDLNLGSGLLAGLLQRFSYRMMEATLRSSERIIVTSRDYFLRCRFSGYIDKIEEVHPPVDDARFGEKDPEALRLRLGLPASCYLIGFVGRIVQEKGLEYLLRAIPVLEDNLDDFCVLIAGDYQNVAGGSVKSQLDPLINSHSGRVRFLGYLAFDELVSFYNLIDVLVLPSIDPLEAFGIVQVEALLCKTPVIVSDMPGVRQVVGRTGYGQVVEKCNPKAIAEAIVALKNQPVEIDPKTLAEFTGRHNIDRYEEIMFDPARNRSVFSPG